jgi:hypothetical protein
MLDFANTKNSWLKEMESGTQTKTPNIFNRVEKAMKGLTRWGTTSDLNEQRDMVLYYLKAASEFDAACREWEAKPTANKAEY